MHLPTAAFPWAACKLDAQQVLCYCHSYIQARQAGRFVSQLLINPHMLRKSTVLVPCLTPTLQSSWVLLFFCRAFVRFLKSDLAFSPQKVKNNFISVTLFFYGFFSGLWGRTQHMQNKDHTLQVLPKRSLKDYCETAERSKLATGMQMNTSITQASRNIITSKIRSK